MESGAHNGTMQSIGQSMSTEAVSGRTCRWCPEEPPGRAATLHGLVMLAVAALVLVLTAALLVGVVVGELRTLLGP